MLRPMRPKPLMPTLMGILPPKQVWVLRRRARWELDQLRNLKC